MNDLVFDAMGCQIRLLVDDPSAAGDARRWVHDYDARLSRFQPDSELCALNRDPRESVPASPLLRTTVSACLWAAQRTNGLVDPTLLDDLEQAGYTGSLTDAPRAALLSDALAAAPARTPAQPLPAAGWRFVSVDDHAGVISRPPGIRIDSGGCGKGLAADALAHRLASRAPFVVDCGGDVRVSGGPFEIQIAHPLTGATVHSFGLSDGAVATSGLGNRIWRTADGTYRHHLLDPATGRPAWTGLIQATAIAPTALEAETLSKASLLSGPEAARAILAPLGGALVHDDGELELVGALCMEEVAA